MTQQEDCDECQKLGQKVDEARVEVYRLRIDHEAAKILKTTNVNKLLAALCKARAIGRTDLRAFQDHIEAHGCKMLKSTHR